eukprot:GHVQ01018118.1.p1 GENE.GHVQ01018118.1~~GHVQ01018118.1.p1  ORF type:complete len:120 (+),score=14.70 GHVQ01018118.1:322-681(+)
MLSCSSSLSSASLFRGDPAHGLFAVYVGHGGVALCVHVLLVEVASLFVYLLCFSDATLVVCLLQRSYDSGVCSLRTLRQTVCLSAACMARCRSVCLLAHVLLIFVVVSFVHDAVLLSWY